MVSEKASVEPNPFLRGDIDKECDPDVFQQQRIRNGETLQTIARLVYKSRKTIILTGAGISSTAGIPDFRSKDGLYNLVKSRFPNQVVRGKDLFDSILFSNAASLSLFCSFMAELRKAVLSADATTTHRFIKLLADKGKLVRNYTQNIDGFEARLGFDLSKIDSKSKVLQLHGDLHTLKCVVCNTIFQYDDSGEYMNQLVEGETPTCPECESKDQIRQVLGKRSIRTGFLRPNIVLYGEPHPRSDLIGRATSSDISHRPDLLLIMGTSLKVTGVRRLVKEFAKAVHARGGSVVFVNRTEPRSSEWSTYIDYFVQGDTDAWIEDLKVRVPELWLMQTKLKTFEQKQVRKKRKKSESDDITYPIKIESSVCYPILQKTEFNRKAEEDGIFKDTFGIFSQDSQYSQSSQESDSLSYSSTSISSSSQLSDDERLGSFVEQPWACPPAYARAAETVNL